MFCVKKDRPLRVYLIIIFILILTACTSQDEEPNKLYVAAASQLQYALSDIGKSFEQETGIEIVFTFGATGILAQQISQGAPYDLFVAADEPTIDLLLENNSIIPESVKHYATGRIALMFANMPTLGEEINEKLLLNTTIKAISIANPEHAPYGKAAIEALEAWGISEQVQPKLVYAENIRQAYQYVSTGHAELGIVALALVIHDNFPYQLIDSNVHQPIVQTLGIPKQTANLELSNQFAEYILSTKGRDIFSYYGYDLP